MINNFFKNMKKRIILFLKMTKRILLLKYLKENIYFLKCNNISIMSFNNWIDLNNKYNLKKNENYNDYIDNINDILQIIKKNNFVQKKNYYQKNKKYLEVNTHYKIGLTEHLLNIIYVYIKNNRISLINKFNDIIIKNIIYKTEYNPLLNPIVCNNINIINNNDIDILYFNLKLFKDLSELDLNIKIKFDIINTIDKITNIHIFTNKYYKTDILYELIEGDFLKNYELGNIMKIHSNIKDSYIIYKKINNINKQQYELTDFIRTEEKYDYTYNEELIINC